MNLRYRPAAVAGPFYPESARELQAEVETLLAQARVFLPESQAIPKAIVVPHAGYLYSGPVAACAYASLGSGAARIRRVILLGPGHRIPLRGLVASGAAGFETPLGVVPLDTAALAAIRHLPQVSINDLAHAQEHALEVQLPFLQCVLDDFSLLPLVVGAATPGEVAQVLDALWGGDETLIVVSSDLSHYLPYEQAQAEDRRTADAVLRLRAQLRPEQACGAAPLNGLLEAARRRGLRPSLLDLRNSGDTAGDRKRVVGYGAFVFDEAPAMAA